MIRYWCGRVFSNFEGREINGWRGVEYYEYYWESYREINICFKKSMKGLNIYFLSKVYNINFWNKLNIDVFFFIFSICDVEFFGILM